MKANITTGIDKTLTTVADMPNVKKALALVKSDLSNDPAEHISEMLIKFVGATYTVVTVYELELTGFSSGSCFDEQWELRVDFTATNYYKFFRGYAYAVVRWDADIDEYVWNWDTSRSSYDGKRYFQLRTYTENEKMEG